MTADADTTIGDDLDGFRPVIPANRYYLDHMLKHVERCTDAVDRWFVDRQAKRGEFLAQIARGERVVMPELDLPELWLPALVVVYLPETSGGLTLAAIDADMESARSKCESSESPQEQRMVLLEIERRISALVEIYVRPYHQLRLEIWTRLQQLDLFDIRKDANAPTDLVSLSNALTIEQMVEQWFSRDPESSIEAFTVSGPLGLTVSLVYRTVTRDGFSDKQADFGSTQAAWLPFIIAFFAGRNGVDPSVAIKLYDQASSNLNPDSKKRASARRKAIASTNVTLLPLDVCVTTKWGLKSVGQPWNTTNTAAK